MDISKSATTGKPDTEASHEPVQQTDACATQRLNIRMAQNILLIWLDSNIDENNADCRNTIEQFRHIIYNINTYADDHECIKFLHAIEHEKACMVISGSSRKRFVPQVHNMTQVDSIFILNDDQQQHEELAQEWPKIKGIFDMVTLLCEALKNTARQCERDAIPITMMAISDDVSQKPLEQLDPLFMCSRILKEIHLSETFEREHLQQFIKYCREVFFESGKEPNSIKELENDYKQDTPNWWHAHFSFLYAMLNRALRQMDVSTIVHMGFFISDLNDHIRHLYRKEFGAENCSEQITLYRGQSLSATQLEELRQTKGGFLSFNNFLSTSKDRQVSVELAHEAMRKSDSVGVLLVMSIDPKTYATRFASITNLSFFRHQESEVLFLIQTIFRIEDISLMAGYDRVFEVKLTMIPDNDKDLCQLANRIRKKYFSSEEGWLRLGSLLLTKGESRKAQEMYDILLNQPIDEDERCHIYSALGRLYDDQGNYTDAAIYYEMSMAIIQQSLSLNNYNFTTSCYYKRLMYYKIDSYAETLSSYEELLATHQQSFVSNHFDLVTSYNNIASAYSTMGGCARTHSPFHKASAYYQKALLCYQNTLAILGGSSSPNHANLATSRNNIASVYSKMGDCAKTSPYLQEAPHYYRNAVLSYKEALKITQKLLGSSHSDIAIGYNNIGSVYSKMGHYAEALSSYNVALSISRRSLGWSHPDLAVCYNNIGSVYSKMGHYAEALSSYNVALSISRRSLDSSHPDLAVCYNNIGSVYSRMGNDAEALSSYNEALSIFQQSLDWFHPDLAVCYNNIGSVYSRMGNDAEALSSYKEALSISRQSLDWSHPDLAVYYNNIGSVYSKMGNDAEALSSYEKALSISRLSLPWSHPDLATCYNNIGSVYSKMGNDAEALSSYEKALSISRLSLPWSHPDLATCYNNIGSVYSKIGSDAEAFSSYNKALSISRRSLGWSHPDLAVCYNNIGSVHSRMGNDAQALSSYEKALSISRLSLPWSHPDLATCYNNIGSVYCKIGEYTKALSYYEKDLQISKQLFPSNHPTLATSHNNVGLLYAKIGDYVNALASHKEALAIRKKIFPENHHDLGISYYNIGSVYQQMNDYTKALAFFEQAAVILRQR